MLYLVRHGESIGNLNKRYCGITDVELSLEGMVQAKIAGTNLKKLNISQIYTSPLKRAYKTAEIISEEISVELSAIECLKEINFGIFENMTWEEMLKDYKSETDNWINQGFEYKFPKGESYIDIIERISDFMNKINDLDNSVIVSHFGVIQSILLYYKSVNYDNLWDYQISNCDIVVLNNKKIEKIIKCNYKNF
ncbi:alpha-ribazole phosphatase [Sedimentibacter acidaminivorans]|uniref:phosphoglycerate mutase (2,3-diphosphoglycerate-dependent) n=1 Tax=Sedimentibacter acidaminivorans TaxID=913099 RepID=A0ABS4GD98_9FIRM|nr:histidine phosphatase family protein [Sedimentibacter acidaminivorans]MBP1925482.1 alpha-ribazole phosphatase [Sedimentibacter acidaminivorans]